jgi:hypothetical protein
VAGCHRMMVVAVSCIGRVSGVRRGGLDSRVAPDMGCVTVMCSGADPTDQIRLSCTRTSGLLQDIPVPNSRGGWRDQGGFALTAIRALGRLHDSPSSSRHGPKPIRRVCPFHSRLKGARRHHPSTCSLLTRTVRSASLSHVRVFKHDRAGKTIPAPPSTSPCLGTPTAQG